MHINVHKQIHIQKLSVLIFIIVILALATIEFGVPLLEAFLIVDRPLTKADALVVMAGSRSERLPAAAKLFKMGTGSRILLTNDGVFSEWSREKQRNLFQVEWAEVELLEMKIPQVAIFKSFYTSSGSIHDALNSRQFVSREGINSIIIVTSDYHTKRSLWTFEQVYRDRDLIIGVYPVRSSLMEMPNYKKIMPLAVEMLKCAYYYCMYSRI